MKNNELIPHLFKTEYSKIVAVLCKLFGISNIQFAEDVVSETFLVATETWGLKGIPNKPKAWLYTVAKNKAKDVFKRNRLFDQKISKEIQNESTFSEKMEIELSDEKIQDNQLKMLFAVCNPINSVEAQIALALKILCGFGVEEIANAFLTNKASINKRLYRAKEKLKSNKVYFCLPQKHELENRLSNVLKVLYLLFNEGYYSKSSNKMIRKEMCFDAMSLLYSLLAYTATNLPKTNALMALFCFHASRFDARISYEGEQILYKDQNIEEWNFELIERGNYYLTKAETNHYSKYHLEAMIAYWHTTKNDEQNKWQNILQLYNRLIQIEYSPITALNRTYALSKAKDKKTALQEALKIKLENNHLYNMLLAELYKGSNIEKEKEYLQKALKLARSESDKKLISKKMAEI